MNDLLFWAKVTFEGFRLYDIKRLYGTVGITTWNDDNFIFPIPFVEIEANPGLEQTPGY